MTDSQKPEMTLVLELPPPISTNSLFANVRGKGRIKTKRYNTWCWHAASMLSDVLPHAKIKGPVDIVYHVGEEKVSPLMDGDNTMKAYTDALVTAGVIEDDSRKTVRSVGMEWMPNVEGTIAFITPVEIG